MNSTRTKQSRQDLGDKLAASAAGVLNLGHALSALRSDSPAIFSDESRDAAVAARIASRLFVAIDDLLNRLEDPERAMLADKGQA